MICEGAFGYIIYVYATLRRDPQVGRPGREKIAHDRYGAILVFDEYRGGHARADVDGVQATVVGGDIEFIAFLAHGIYHSVTEVM